jgi:hypothetical protein
MSAPKGASNGDAPGAAAGGAGGAPPPPAHRRPPPAEDDDAYERRLKLTDVIGFVALNGYAREADACAGLCRETWRCIPAGLSAADADRVRRDHPLWQAIIDLKHGWRQKTRLIHAAQKGDLARVRELCDWRADVEAEAGPENFFGPGFVPKPLLCASEIGRVDIVRELLARGANINAADIFGTTPLMLASALGKVEVVRALLAAGADKHLMDRWGATAASQGGNAFVYHHAPFRDAILALLAAAP